MPHARLALLAALVAAALLVPVGLAAGVGAGTFAVEDGSGSVTVSGRGTLVGRIDKGELAIWDLSPGDSWSPRVNGVPRGKVVSLRGKSVNIFIPGGRYRIVLRGDGISLSARGEGVALVRARQGQAKGRGPVGTYAVGDAAPQALPDDTARVVFGTPDNGGDTTP